MLSRYNPYFSLHYLVSYPKWTVATQLATYIFGDSYCNAGKWFQFYYLSFNQVHADMRLVKFVEIAFIWEVNICVCLCVCVHPEAINS